MGIYARLFRYIYRWNEKLNSKTLSTAIRRGFTLMIPFVFIGSFALFLISLPIPAYQDFMTHTFGNDWKDYFLSLRDATYNVLSLIMIVCVSYSYAAEKDDSHISPILAAMVSLSSFMAVSCISKVSFSLSSFGVVGIFVALLVTVISSQLFFRFSRMKIFRLRVFSDGASSNLNSALESLFPATLTISVFAAASIAIRELFGISDLQVFFSDCLFTFFSGISNEFARGFLFTILVHIMWFFGIHGNNMLESVAIRLFRPGIFTNQLLLASGSAPTQICTKTFFDTFVLIGGCGTGLCLVLAILIAGKRKSEKSLAHISLIPVIFNINELVVFGLPIVLNPVYLIPFIGVPLLLMCTSYLALKTGLVPLTVNLTEWTTPVFLSGYISVSSIRGSLLQLFNLALGTICYIPFVKLSTKMMSLQMKNGMDKVYVAFDRQSAGQAASGLIERHDDVGRIAKALISELEYDIDHGSIDMHYQPISDYNGKVVYVEALLRWKHSSYGYISPALVIELAEEAEIITKLGYAILDRACADLKMMTEAGTGDIMMSVNVSASQLENPDFIDNLQHILNKYEIDPKRLLIEITEGVALSDDRRVLSQLRYIKQMGAGLGMDDFGMGHSSLMYLMEYDFDMVKLDGSLVKEIVTNRNCRDIVSSIVSLGETMNFSVIAEFVETDEQKDILRDLRCNLYQGYIFSPAIPNTNIVEYIRERNFLYFSEC